MVFFQLKRNESYRNMFFLKKIFRVLSRIVLCNVSGDGRAVNHEVRKRVVREFGLPDVAVEVLRHAPKETCEDFPGSQESLLLSQCSNEKVCICCICTPQAPFTRDRIRIVTTSI